MTEQSSNLGNVAPEGTPVLARTFARIVVGTGDIEGAVCEACDGRGLVIEGIGGG